MPHTTYETYGFRSRDIEWIAAELGLALGVLFISRRIEFLGRLYQAGTPFGEHFELLYNDDDYGWMEPQYKQFATVLYINRTDRPEEIAALIGARFEDRAGRIRCKTFEKVN